VTRLAQRHEVGGIAASAFGERENMVYLLGGCQLTLLPALLAQRVRLDVSVTDAFPSTTISFVGSRVAFVLVVMFVCRLLMLGTVLLAHGKPTAAGVGAGTLWFVWHGFTSVQGKEKATGDFSSMARTSILFAYHNTNIRGGMTNSDIY